MPENKTQQAGSPYAFIAAIADDRKRVDAETLVKLMSEVTGEPAELWYRIDIGFGSGGIATKADVRADWFFAGFSPRKTNLTVYLPGGFDALQSQLDRLAKALSEQSLSLLQSDSAISISTFSGNMVTISSDWARSSPSALIARRTRDRPVTTGANDCRNAK